MQRIFLLLVLTTCYCFSSKAQRILETVLDPANPQQQNVSYRGRVLIAGGGDSYLLVYNDVTFSRLNYPMVGGVRLRFDTYRNPLTPFELAVFFVLGTSSTARYLYRLSGATFSRIAITGSVISNCIVYRSSLYFLTDVSGSRRLFRYSGGVVTEVAGAAIPTSDSFDSYELHVAGDYMYITGFGLRRGSVNFIRRYNGVGFLTLPYTGPGTDVDDVYAVPATSRVYFTSHGRIIYYDGLTVRQVFLNTGEGVLARMFGSSLYFTTGVGLHPERTSYMYRLTGAALSEVLFPTGYRLAQVGATNPEIYSGALYVGATHTDGSSTVMRYDGTSFSSFFPIHTPVGEDGILLFLREGNLMIQPHYHNGNHVFEYNGAEFTKIIAPTDRLLFPYINSTACNHLWLNYYTDDSGIRWAYAKESKDCPPPPPPPGTIAVIPEHFRDYERFESGLLAPERGWCWSEIIIDWGIDSVCPLPPCPDFNYGLRMIDVNDKVAWSEQFSKTSFFKVPLPDEQPFRTILSSPDKKTDLLIFEPELVSKGIDLILVGMKPKEGILLLSASTRKDLTVPLNVRLLNADGKTIWEQTFIAPFAQEISAKVREPGVTLVFSIPDEGLKLITDSKASHQNDVGRK